MHSNDKYPKKQVVFIVSLMDLDLQALFNLFKKNKPSFIDNIYKSEMINAEILITFIDTKK